MRVARINTSFVNGANHNMIVNIELWEELPADSAPFTFRQIDGLNETSGPPAGSSQYPVSSGCSALLGSPDQYFDMSGDQVHLQFMPTQVT